MKNIKQVYLVVASLLVAVAAVVALNVTGTTSQAVVNRSNCSNDEIIRCGVTSKEDLVNKYDQNVGNVQAIYKHYGITRGDLTGTDSVIKMGTVYQDGRVVVDGKTVATNAYSVSRVKFSNASRPVTIDGVTLWEGPDMSIFVRPVDAFVFFRGGEFHRGVLVDCANPILAKPIPQPTFKCDSLTVERIARDRFKFTAKATAANGAVIESYTFNFGDGSNPVTVKTSSTTAAYTHTYTKTGNFKVKVTANIKVNGKTESVSGGNCETTVTVDKAPVFKCESLKISKAISRTEFELTATATAENATIKSYTFKFGDGESKVVTTNAKTASTTHKYADKAATYTAEVIVTMSDGQVAPTTQNCKVVVKVHEKEAPSIEIDKTVNGKEHDKVRVGEEFTYKITVRNTGNVIIKDAVVTDKAPKEVTLLSASAGKISGNTWVHTISELKIGESKSFTIKAKYGTYAGGTHKNTVCVDTPTVPGSPDDCDEATTETNEPIKVCDLKDNTVKTIERSEYDESHMTTDISKCGDIKVCIIKDKEIKTIPKNAYDESTMTTDLDKCATIPEELPETGVGSFIGGGLGLGSITAAGYYWSASRRNLLNALLKK